MKLLFDSLLRFLLSMIIGLIILSPNILYSFPNESEQPGKVDYSDPIIRYGGNHAFLTISKISDRTFVITLSPLESIHSTEPDIPTSDLLLDYSSEDLWSSRTIMDPVRGEIGEYTLEILRSPLRVNFRRKDDTIVQQLVWPDSEDGRMEFQVTDPVFGLDFDGDQPDQKSKWIKINNKDEHHSELNFTPLFSGSEGWSIFIALPESINNSLTILDEKGLFLPDQQKLDLPVQLFLTFWDEPEQMLSEYSVFAGESLMDVLLSSNIKELKNTHDGTE